MPIAVNMQQVNFQFGDYIQREGQVPKGLYLIKSGQCNVSKTCVSTREHNAAEVQGWRRLLKDKNPLFNDFDVENSLFNNVKLQYKINQNSKVFVTENGEQIKNKV